MSYSTCSLNPIENEAVVAAVLKKYGDKIEVLEVSLPGFKFQPGFKTWQVQTFRSAKAVAEDGEAYEKFNSWEEVPEALRNVHR